MEKKNIDHGPTAYGWGVFVGSMITLYTCKYFPQDAAWWQEALLGIGSCIVLLLIPLIWIPGPEKREDQTKKES